LVVRIWSFVIDLSLKFRYSNFPISGFATRISKSDRAFILGAAVLLVAIFVSYFPAMHGGPVWDDDYMLTQNRVMTEPGGLGRIFFDISAVKVYYPVTEAVLWLECRFFGLGDLTGYHVVNTLIHAIDTILIWRLLRRLNVPGSFVAAAFFGLHPVQVESVAWVTETKNTLSLFFYLATMWGYLRYRRIIGDAPIRQRAILYFISLAAFALALGSKTTVTTLPPAALLITWWKTGRIKRSDILAIAPFFLLAIGSGMLTQWVELHTTGTWNPAWSLSPMQQILVAGRAICFYALELVCPIHLSFAYPRWHIDPGNVGGFVYPLAVVTMVAVLWGSRNRIGRGPVVAALFFAGTLMPALGFFHVLYQRYSFVADHFQYLASIGPLALLAAAITMAFSRINSHGGYVAVVACLLIGLCVLTANSASRFRSDQAVWAQALSLDPDSPLAGVNYGSDLIDDGRYTDAEHYLNHTAKLHPESAAAWAGLGRIAETRRQFGLAMEYYQRAVQLEPIEPRFRFQLGNMLLIGGEFTQAAQQYKSAEQIDSDWAELHDNLGVCYLHMNRVDLAEAEFEEAMRLKPDMPLVRKHLDQAAAMRPGADSKDGTSNIQH
jgi:Tfp pilus assembly protein PilF